MKKPRLSVIVLSVLLLVCAGCQQAPAAAAPVMVNLQGHIPGGMNITAVGVSCDRTRALVDGFVKAPDPRDSNSFVYERHCFILDLRKGLVTRLADLVPGGKAPAWSATGSVALSPDGRHLALVFAEPSRSRIQLIELATGKVAAELDKPGPTNATWAGRRLLLHWNCASQVQAFNLETKRLADLPLFAVIHGADSSGSRLLASAGKDPTKKTSEEGRGQVIQAVITPEGRVLRQIDSGGDSCERQAPVISPSGKYVCLIYLPKSWKEFSDVSTRVLSIDTGRIRDLRPWSYFTALTDNGEPIICSEDGMKIGRTQWETLVAGDRARAGKIVGNEFFYVAEPTWVFKSVPLPASPGR